jgi:2-C-methyl-D-erythritol 4-phosphate cytidylyltransferase
MPSTPDSHVFALVPAAGSGSRMGGEVPKQYAPLAGRTMLEHAIDALLADARIERVLVVVAPDDIRHRGLACEARVEFVAAGGASRAESVRNGLARLAMNASAEDWVLVHDAARPCLAREELTALIDALIDDPVGGLLAVPIADTIKREDQGRVAQTVERACLWRALTPQMFRLGVLDDAFERVRDPAAITDESSAVERIGHAPRLVPGRASNIKVTRPDDLPLAEAILRLQGRCR